MKCSSSLLLFAGLVAYLNLFAAEMIKPDTASPQAALQKAPHLMTQSLQQSLSPNEVLERLKAGNKRFLSGNMLKRNLVTKANLLAAAQYPMAVILNCMDSRTPTELTLDQGLGDIFVIRIAGNIRNNDIIGSMEFATQLAGAKLIAVIGHTNCGAVKGACQQAKLGSLTNLLQKIQPAIQQATNQSQTKDCSDPKFIDQIAKNNVLLVLNQIKERSPVIKKLLDEGKIGLVGGMQNIATGEVVFYDEGRILHKVQK